jgi:hypothetical protein
MKMARWLTKTGTRKPKTFVGNEKIDENSKQKKISLRSPQMRKRSKQHQTKMQNIIFR